MKAQSIINSWKVPTKNAKIKKEKSTSTFWRPSSIGIIIKREAYTGKTYIRKLTKNTNPNIKKKRIIRPKEEWIEIKTPKIIPQELFDKAQIVLKKSSEYSLL